MATINYRKLSNLPAMSTDLPKVDANECIRLWIHDTLQEIYNNECYLALLLFEECQGKENGKTIEKAEAWRDHAKDYAIRMGLEWHVNAMYEVLSIEPKLPENIHEIDDKELDAIIQIGNILRSFKK